MTEAGDEPEGMPRTGDDAPWGSDAMADAVRDTGVPFIALTPGASFRGLHDSLVNHLGNERPQILLCIHEEHAVAIAHGYAKVTGRPLAVALHSNVGLMHATMAIFNAYSDRVPMLILGADGPADAAKRRPWIDWLHTSADVGALVRHFVKWDDHPMSAAAAVPAILRGNQLTRSAPSAPVFVCLDAAAQEERLSAPVRSIRCEPLPAPVPDPDLVDEAARLLRDAERPVILLGRVGRGVEQWRRRVELAEKSGARVITNHKLGAAFPTDHPRHIGRPALFLSADNTEVLRGADVILSLDWLDLGGTLNAAFGDGPCTATVISASLEHQLYDGWNKLDFAPATVDIALLCAADTAVRLLLAVPGDDDSAPSTPVPALPPPGPAPRDLSPSGAPAADPAEAPAPAARLTVRTLQRALRSSTPGQSVSLLRVPFAWDFAEWPLTGPLDYLGGDGGGGIGAGPGMAVGAALALRDTDRLPVAVLGDGDFLMGATALWTAARYRIPLLILVANNSSFYNDEIHQTTMARQRDRPIANAHIGLRIDEPDPRLNEIASAQGWDGFGPIRTADALAEALETAIRIVRSGGRALLDVRVERGYGPAGHNTTPS